MTFKKKTAEGEQSMSKTLDMIPVGIEFMQPTQVFQLGNLGTVTAAMVDMTIVEPYGVVLTSKNKQTRGVQLIPWAGIKSLRLKTMAELKEEAQ